MSQQKAFEAGERQRAAAETVSNLEFLLKRPEFTAYTDRLRREADKMADEVLHNDALTPTEREAMRQRRQGLLIALAAPMEDIQACRNVMKAG
jgi:hypothetical protein